MRRLVAPVLTLALLAAGCSGADDLAAASDCEELATASVGAFQAVLDVVDTEVGPLLAEITVDPALDRPGNRRFADLLTLLSPQDREVTIAAFLSLAEGSDELEALRSDVEQIDGVISVVYFSKQDALEEAREVFADEPQLLEQIEADPDVLPASFRIQANREDAESIEARLGTMPGVREVSGGSATARALDAGAATTRAFLADTGFVEMAERVKDLGCDREEFLRLVGTKADQLDPGGPYAEELVAGLSTAGSTN